MNPVHTERFFGLLVLVFFADSTCAPVLFEVVYFANAETIVQVVLKI
jgi:hypothetical protein